MVGLNRHIGTAYPSLFVHITPGVVNDKYLTLEIPQIQMESVSKIIWNMQRSELFGKAFENWCFHELNTYSLYIEAFDGLFYLQLLWADCPPL